MYTWFLRGDTTGVGAQWAGAAIECRQAGAGRSGRQELTASTDGADGAPLQTRLQTEDRQREYLV